MDTRPLYSSHSRALTTLYGDLESHALSQREVFVGTAGSVLERRNASGFRFYAHQYYGADGKKREQYLAGPIGTTEAETAAEAMRARIREVKDLVGSLRMLGREGFHLVDPKTYGTLASLHNHGIFSAGGMLIGSHAYGVLLNRMGVRAAAYTTEDIDIARGEALALARLPEGGFLKMLRDSGIDFVEVPELDRKKPATSFKQYLGYLLAASQTAMLAAREGCCAVRIPLPERFAIHKLIVSRLRIGREAKSGKDLHQAAVLCAVLAENHPGALEEALAEVPARAKKHLKSALRSVAALLEGHPRALEELGIGSRKT